MTRPIRISPEVSEWIHSRKSDRLNTPNKVLREFFGLPVEPRRVPVKRKARTNRMTLVLHDGRRINLWSTRA